MIQASDPWVSTKDIDRGALWFQTLNEELAKTNIGIICLTKENLMKPWILFEAGALAKGLSTNRVIMLLIDLQPTDLSSPLSQFNAALPDQSGVWEVVRTVNASLGEMALDAQTLQKVFETYYPQWDKSLKHILSTTTETPLENRGEPDMLREVLGLVRGMDRRLAAVESDQRVVERKQHSSHLSAEELAKRYNHYKRDNRSELTVREVAELEKDLKWRTTFVENFGGFERVETETT